MDTKQKIILSVQQARDIMKLMGVTGSIRVAKIRENNHVWRLDCGQNRYFLKIFTKDWYSDDTDEYPVEHEQGAYACLAVHDVLSACVALAQLNCDNPLARPFIMTKRVPGKELMELLEDADQENRDAILRATGGYIRRVHNITFDYPGFVDSINGPSSAPDENGYQHDVWTAKQKKKKALAQLKREEESLPSILVDKLCSKFSMMEEKLAHLYQPPRFVLTNSQIDHIFLVEDEGRWRVSGCIDMEAASAGNSAHDLVFLALQIATICENSTYWWKPFFAGYGDEPDFELFQLQMLACADHCYRFGIGWSGTRRAILERIAGASSWDELFAAQANRMEN